MKSLLNLTTFLYVFVPVIASGQVYNWSEKHIHTEPDTVSMFENAKQYRADPLLLHGKDSSVLELHIFLSRSASIVFDLCVKNSNYCSNYSDKIFFRFDTQSETMFALSNSAVSNCNGFLQVYFKKHDKNQNQAKWTFLNFDTKEIVFGSENQRYVYPFTHADRRYLHQVLTCFENSKPWKKENVIPVVLDSL